MLYILLKSQKFTMLSIVYNTPWLPGLHTCEKRVVVRELRFGLFWKKEVREAMERRYLVLR